MTEFQQISNACMEIINFCETNTDYDVISVDMINNSFPQAKLELCIRRHYPSEWIISFDDNEGFYIQSAGNKVFLCENIEITELLSLLEV